MGTHIYMLWWSGETTHACVHDSVTKESKLTALAFRFRWGGAAGGVLGKVELRKTFAACMCVWLRYMCG